MMNSMAKQMLSMLIDESLKYAVRITFLEQGWGMDQETSNNILTHIRDTSLKYTSSGSTDDNAAVVIKRILDSNEIDLYEAFLLGIASANALIQTMLHDENE